VSKRLVRIEHLPPAAQVEGDPWLVGGRIWQAFRLGKREFQAARWPGAFNYHELFELKEDP
jgi:hypothetical protein